jgi:predicted PurR-regulated permease PerM
MYTSEHMERRYIESFFFLALLLGTLAVVVVMFLPFMNILILAAILAFLFSVPYERLVRALGGRRSLAALLMTLVMLVTILVPLALVGWRIAQEATALYTDVVTHANSQTLPHAIEQIQTYAQQFFPGLRISAADLNAQAQRVFGLIAGQLGALFAGVIQLVAGFFFLLLFFFFMIRDGSRLKRRIMELSPLSDEQEERISEKIGKAISSTVRGKIVISIIQGLAAGLGMLLFGIPNPALWGALTMLASFIPSIGTGIVLLPAVIYLFITSTPAAAVGLALWGIAVVGLLDNVLGPKLMTSGTRLHPLVMMLAVLGGIALFGPIGLLLGPILIALLYALLDIYLSIIRRPTHHA